MTYNTPRPYLDNWGPIGPSKAVFQKDGQKRHFQYSHDDNFQKIASDGSGFIVKEFFRVPTWGMKLFWHIGDQPRPIFSLYGNPGNHKSTLLMKEMTFYCIPNYHMGQIFIHKMIFLLWIGPTKRGYQPLQYTQPKMNKLAHIKRASVRERERGVRCPLLIFTKISVVIRLDLITAVSTIFCVFTAIQNSYRPFNVEIENF